MKNVKISYGTPEGYGVLSHDKERLKIIIKALKEKKRKKSSTKSSTIKKRKLKRIKGIYSRLISEKKEGYTSREQERDSDKVLKEALKPIDYSKIKRVRILK